METTGNPTPSQRHAAVGQTRFTRASVDKPDTIIMLPNGQQMALRRGLQQDSMPIFRKLAPKKFQREASKAGGRSTFSNARKVPFTQFLMAAFVLHQLVGFARGWWRRWQQRRSRQLAVIGEQGEWEEEVAPEVAEADARLRKELLPAMMRSAMPKPQHRSRAQELAHAHRSKPRHVPTAGKMIRPSDNVARKKPGMLGRLDQAMRQQVRELAMAQEQAHHLQLEAAKQALLLQGAELQRLPAPEHTAQTQGNPQTVQPAAVPVRRR